MEKSKKLNLIGVLLLFSATIVWGSSFFILKSTIEHVPAFYVISIRFLIAGIGLGLIFWKKTRAMDKKTFWRGVIIGAVLAAAYATQTIGLKYTSPGKNAFLTSSYCIMCPFIVWLIYKVRPKLYHVVSAILCLIGIGLVCLSGVNEGISFLGDGLTLISAIFFALQIIFIDRYQGQGYDSIKMLIVEVVTVGVLIMFLSLIFELPKGISTFALNGEQIWKILYLTMVCTLYAQFALIFGQRFTTVNEASIILCLESVFGTLFSIIFTGEYLSITVIIGFVVIFIAMMISELKLDLFEKFRRKSKQKLN